MRARTVLLLLLCAAITGCGTSGDPLTRPIEVLYYVSGGSGLQFELVAAASPSPGVTPAPAPDCGSNTLGIQSPNASHQFAGRTFQTPHLFVLENDRQPVRAAIRNIDSMPIRVDLYLGQNPQQSNVTIDPGECVTVSQEGVFRPGANMQFPAPNLRGPEVRVEVCSPQPTPPIGLTTACVNPTPDATAPA